jgi:DNA-binding SARP family transcriptional activator
MVKGGAKPGWPVDRTYDWRKASELIQAGQYEQVAEILHEAQAASEQVGDEVFAGTLAAACQICLACSQCRAQVEWHQQACENADEREQELRQKLRAILDLASGRALPDTPGKQKRAPCTPTVDTSPPERGVPKPAKRLTMRQRVQSLVRRGFRSRSPDLEASKALTEKLAPASGRNREGQDPPSLTVYCLGPFRVYQDDKLITDWPSGKGKAIFKYMVANHSRSIPKDILMDLFWRNADPEAARNNLHVAIYGLRQAFRAMRPSFPHILFQDDHYLFNPAMAVWVDADEFVQCCEAGQSLETKGKLTEATSEYEVAESLYQGDFLEEDLYEDWPMLQREGLKDSYLIILDRLSRHYLDTNRYAACIHLCQKILAKDGCREDGHRRLIKCYCRQGQRNLALRQYHLCMENLEQVLDVPPMHETTTLYHQVRHGEKV